MINRAFLLEQGTLLSRISSTSFMIYVYYDNLKDSQGYVSLTYQEIGEHCNVASSTLSKAHQLLTRLKLIEQSEEGKIKVLPHSSLSDQEFEEICIEYQLEGVSRSTSIQLRFGESPLPQEFQQLLNKKTLRIAKKTLKEDFFKTKRLCEYFKLDHKAFIAIRQREKFSKQFIKLIKEVEEEYHDKNQKKEPKFDENVRSLVRYLYDELAKREAKPIGQWWLKNCNIAKSLLSSGLEVEEAKIMIDWAFNDKWWSEKLTNLKALETIGPQFRLHKKKERQLNKITRRTQLPEEVKTELFRVGIKIPIQNYEDAYFLKQHYLSGEKKPEVIQAVEILERYCIVPKGISNITF